MDVLIQVLKSIGLCIMGLLCMACFAEGLDRSNGSFAIAGSLILFSFVYLYTQSAKS